MGGNSSKSFEYSSNESTLEDLESRLNSMQREYSDLERAITYPETMYGNTLFAQHRVEHGENFSSSSREATDRLRSQIRDLEKEIDRLRRSESFNAYKPR